MARRLWTRDKLDVIERLLSDGKSYSDIAKEMGITEINLRFLISHYKLKPSGESQKKAIKRAKDDLATRIRILRGEEIRKDKPYFSFTDEQIAKWLERDGFVLFAKELLDVELQDYQIEMIRNILNHKRVCVVAGRGTGKSFTVAIACLYISITRSNQKILIISPAQRQSDLLYNKILEFIGKNNELFNSVEKSNQESCKFTNNSTLYPLPSTTFIRGFQNVDFIFCDESAYFLNPDAVWASIEPMLAIKNDKGEYGALIVVGSPSGKMGKLWECFNDPLYAKMQIPSTKNIYVSQQWIEEQRMAMPTAIFECEIMANFSESVDNFFSNETILKCSMEYDFTSFPSPYMAYYLGVDIGRIKDSSVLTILSKDNDGNFRIENIKELTNTPFNQQIETIKWLHKTYNFRKICVEKAGLSLPVVEQLKGEGLPIKEFEPTIDNKAEAYNHLLRQMEDGKIVIPRNHQKLQYELRTFKYEITAQGKMKLHHETELSGDDFVDSLCFAIWAAKTSEWRPFSDETMKKWNEYMG
jgi:hypothetical protein